MIKKHVKDINVSDAFIDAPKTKNSSTNIELKLYEDVCEGDIRLHYNSISVRPGIVYGGKGTMYLSGIKDKLSVFPENSAKKARRAYLNYTKDLFNVYTLYKRSLPKKEMIPLYFVDSYHLNVPIQEGDNIVDFSKEGIIKVINVHDTDYYKVQPTVVSDEGHEIDNYYSLLYDWLQESGESYDIWIPGSKVTMNVLNNTCDEIHDDTTHPIGVSTKAGQIYLVKGMTFSWLQERIINVTLRLYSVLYELSAEEYKSEILPKVPVSYRNEEYFDWDFGGNVTNYGDLIRKQILTREIDG